MLLRPISRPVNYPIGSPISSGDEIFPGAILDLDFANSRYYWNGTTSLTTAVTCVRADNQNAIAQNYDGTWLSFEANTPRVTTNGLLVELQTTNYCKRSRDFLNATWSSTNLTLSDAGDNPVIGVTSIFVDVLPAGTTSWVVPAGVFNLIFVAALGPGGNGANGTTATNGGGGGGGGAFAKRSNIAVTPDSTLTVQVGAGGSGSDTFLKDSGGTTQVSAAAGGNAAGATRGDGGASGSSIGSTVRSGGNGGSGSSGAGNRGGGAGGGAANDTAVGGSNAAGRTGSGGNTIGGGGGGGALGGGATASTAASAGVGGTGGQNISGTGAGAGGTTSTAATAGTDGGGGGGGLSGTGINGAAGSSSTWNYTSGAFSQNFTGAGGGGGGGGFAGNGAIGGLGAGGGGGGSTAGAAGTGAAGGDGTLIIVYGAANATRITATSANATLKQTITVSAGTKTPSILMRPHTVTGPILLSQDDGVSATDISDQLISGRYQQVFAPNQSVLNPVWRLEIVNSGDAVDIDYAQLEDNEFATSPIETTSANAIRHVDNCTLNLNNFTPFVTNDDITVMMIVSPGRYGVSTTGTETFGGWTWCDMGGFGPSIGTIDISGISGTVMTVTDTHGIDLVTHIKLSGAGVTANTTIQNQISGVNGGAGTYTINPSQTVGAGSPEIIPQYGYIANATKKPAPGLRQNIGVTVMNGANGLSYGFDPQTAQYVYNSWNRCAYTTRASLEAGIVALAGNLEFSTPRGSWAEPQYHTDFQIGSIRWPVASNPLTGFVAKLIVTPQYDPTGATISLWTAQDYP